MNFDGLSSYLKKFQTLLGDKKEEKETIRRTLEQITGIQISPQLIELRNSVVFLNLSPIQKTEVFLQKKEIVKILQEKKVFIVDLR